MADYGYSPSTVTPFANVAHHWKEKIQSSLEYKEKHFQRDANEARMFLKGGKALMEHLYGSDSVHGVPSHGDFRVNDVKAPAFLITTNRVAEMKDLIGPHLYHKNPYRQVNPRTRPEMPAELFFPPLPQPIQQMLMTLPPEDAQAFQEQIAQQQQQQYQAYLDEIHSGDTIDKTRGILLSSYLNYTPLPLHLRDEQLMCVGEALVDGLGLMWTETYRAPGSDQLFVGSFFEANDNFSIDPDMESIENALACYRRRIRPVWQVEDEYTIPYGFPRGYLKGNASSQNEQDAYGPYKMDPEDVERGRTNDLLVYWEVYSKCGLGAKLKGVQPELRAALDQFGDYTYMVLCNTCQVPINFLGSKDGEDLQRRMRWPCPFWRDGKWPFTPYQFHKQSRNVWPYSHIKPALPELKFLNWFYSFIACKVRNTSQDIIAVLATAAKEFEQALKSGADRVVVPLKSSDGSLDVNQIVQWLQSPNMQTDIWTVADRLEQQFERRTAMTPLLYGEITTQSRLAGESEFRKQASMSRIEDMAEHVEESATQQARNEAMAARYHLIARRDIAPIMGMAAARYWEQYVTPADIDQLLHDLDYRIEAGSIRKPNRERDTTNMTSAMQTAGPILERWASATGDVEPLNALIEDWGKPFDIDTRRYRLTPPQPPDPNQPTPEQQAAQLEAEKMQMEMQVDQQKAEMDMQAKQMDLAVKEREAQLSLAQQQQEMIQQDRQWRQEMTQLQAKHALEMRQMRDKAAAAKRQQVIKERQAKAKKPAGAK